MGIPFEELALTFATNAVGHISYAHIWLASEHHKGPQKMA